MVAASRRLIPVTVVAGLLALVGAVCVGATSGSRMTSSALPPAAALAAVRDRVETWLDANRFRHFKVDEVMVFTNNDYVAVSDAAGRPAFELLVAPDRSWLMEEPASMMWNSKYGMLPHTSATIEPIPGLNMMWARA